MRALLLTLCLITCGCPRALSDSYACTVSSQCVTGGRQGVCESTGACSFPDASCASGRRYGDLGPTAIAGACVVVDTDLGIVVWPDAGADLAMSGGSPGITRVGSSKLAPGAPAGGTAVVIAIPTGVAPNDLLFATVYANDSTSAITAPQGWTLHGDIAVGQKFHVVWFYKLHAAADPSPTAFTVTNSPATVAAAIVAYRGVEATSPIDAAMSKQFVGTAYVAPSITTTHANDMLVAMFIDQTQGALLSPPSGMTSAVDDSAIFVFDQLQPVAGASGNKSAGSLPGVGAVDFVALTPAP